MPDVKVKIFVDGQCVRREAKEALLDEVPGIIADAMDCWVWSWKWPFRRHLKLSPENVDVMIFWDDESTMNTFDVFSNTQIIVEVAAHAYRDRKANMNRRITHISRRIKEVADADSNDTFAISITFIPVKSDYWAKVQMVEGS